MLFFKELNIGVTTQKLVLVVNITKNINERDQSLVHIIKL